MISFILNNKTIHTDASAGSTLLDFVRYEKHLVGTKIGCREGDCGACTLLIGNLQGDQLRYQSMTSCITPLGNVQGKHVLTVEGINGPQLSPVQSLMISNNGTQCGFCTIGFVMSLTGFVLSDEATVYKNALKAIDGNICRCTGYKSIERAALALCEVLEDKPKAQQVSWLAEKGYIPQYLTTIKERLRQFRENSLSPVPQKMAPDYFMGGGTDLLVQKPEVLRQSSTLNKFDDPQLRGIKVDNGICTIGAATTVTDFETSEAIHKLFPQLTKYLRLVSSTPIRNMATMAGNIVNASPIGDMTIFFLALNSNVILSDGHQQRNIPLKRLYLDYKKLDKAPTEYLEGIQFPIPVGQWHFNFEKVSKRTHLDIASVNSACQLLLHPDGSIAEAHISAGGVAAIPKYLTNASAYLGGKKLDQNTLEHFLEILDQEVAPISDARGSAIYKRRLLRQLVLAHFITFFGPTEAISKTLGL